MEQQKTIAFVVYACETNLLTDEERESGDYEPLADIEIPEAVARAFYDETDARKEVAEELGIPEQDATFEMWHDAVYTADSTVGLCEFARKHGCTNI